MTRTERRHHLLELADELAVSIELERARNPEPGHPQKCGEAHSLTGTAVVFGWTGDNISYFVGLHELGHFACGHMSPVDEVRERAYWDRLVEAEAEAWAWAFEATRDRLLPRTLRLIRDQFLGSYVRQEGLQTAGVVFSGVAERVGLVAA